MNLHQMVISSRVSTLSIINPTIIHIVPDFGANVASLLFQSGLRLMNCGGVVSKSAPQKLGQKTFNARQIYLNAKNILTNTKLPNSEEHHKMIPVFQDLPKDIHEFIEERKFLIIDHTLITQASEYITGLTTPKQGAFFLLQQLKREFQFAKSKFPNIEHTLFFFLTGPSPKTSLFNFISLLSILNQNTLTENLNIFDKFLLVDIISNAQSLIFPIAHFNKGFPQFYKTNIKRIEEIYKEVEKTTKNKEIIADSPPTEEESSKNTHTVSFIKSQNPIQTISKDLTKPNAFQQTIDIKQPEIISSLTVNQQQLSRILKKYKVTDKTVEDNIRAALDDYLLNTKREVTSENLERIILLAINKTIFNTDEIDDEYLHNPTLLFSKLQEVNTYAKDIHYPLLKDNVALQPSQTISLSRVTGMVRHEYEFSDNIHQNIKTLFKALESRPNSPVKIQSFKHDYEDNNLNRVINYKITLKNLAGGNSDPYTVNIKVPALVNNRYFKLNGKTYILANQQFFVPITKTEPSQCRFLSSYCMLTMSVQNMKMNLSEIDKIVDYIQIYYQSAIVDIEMSSDKKLISVILQDNAGKKHTIQPQSITPYISEDQLLFLDEDTGRWMVQNLNTNNIEALSVGKSEFIYTRLVEIMRSYNKLESLRKSAKSIPYIQIHFSGVKVPMIVYLWQQLGLPQALTRLGIPFEISEPPAKNTPNIAFRLLDNKFVYIYPENERQTLIANGLLTVDSKKYIFTAQNIHQPSEIEPFIIDKNGTRAVYNLNLNTANAIDSITGELLEYHNMPTNIIDLVCNTMVQKLLNSNPDSLTDLKIYRSRQAEIVFNLLYKVLMSAHNTYVNELRYNDSAKLFLREDYVIECLLGVHPHSKGSSVLELAQPYNPVAELKLATKLIKTGPGGVPDRRSFKKEHRNIHPSHYGNIGANATTEYADVGLTNHMTLSPLLSNRYGSYGSKDISKSSGWELLSTDEALIPFVNELQADRCVIAYTHRAQTTPIKDGDIPIVATGAEFLVPQLASTRFVNRAEQDGTVEEVVPDKYVKVKYKNNKIEYIDTTPRLATTKRSSHIRLGMKSLEVGDKFKANDLLTWTNSFNNGAYATGRNLTMALMNYIGLI